MRISYADIFKSIPIKDQSEAEKILNMAFSLLCSLKEGDSLTTSFATFNKISPELIYIDHKNINNLILDELEKSNIAKL